MVLASRCQDESVIVGPRGDDANEFFILNRMLIWIAGGIGYHIGQKYAKVLVEEWLGKGARPVKTPGMRKGAGIRAPADHQHDRCVRKEEVEASGEQARRELAGERRPDRRIRSEGIGGD